LHQETPPVSSSTKPSPEVTESRRHQRHIRPFLLVGTVLLVIGQIVVLSPASLEESRNVVLVEPEKLLEWVSGQPHSQQVLATGIPTGRIPDYSVDQFDFLSSREGSRDWRLQAIRAHLFNQERLVHATTVKAYLFDSEGKTTIVTGKEAKYFMNARDLEIFGDVRTVFPDGFELKSEYLRYRPNERRVQIPATYAVQGNGVDVDQSIAFTSMGFDFSMARQVITLPAAVRLTMKKTPPAKSDATVIESDRCVIHRRTKIANFSMSPGRANADKFVWIRQPTLLVKSRRAELRYGDSTTELHYMTASQDVLIRETGNGSALRYATAGQADFDTQENRIVLSEFPQVYQDNDTVVGDMVVLHRDTDIVEVRNSNAFTQSNRQ